MCLFGEKIPLHQDMLMQAAVEAAVAENLKPLELDVNTVGEGMELGHVWWMHLFWWREKKQNSPSVFCCLTGSRIYFVSRARTFVKRLRERLWCVVIWYFFLCWKRGVVVCQGMSQITGSENLSQDASVDSGLAVALKDVGRVDVLVNNAGYSQAGSVEMVSMEQMKAQLETNLCLGRSSFVFCFGGRESWRCDFGLPDHLWIFLKFTLPQ